MVRGTKVLVMGLTDWDHPRAYAPKGEDHPRKDYIQPSRMQGFAKFEIVAVFSGPAAAHTVAVSADGRAIVWGQNKFGQLGIGDVKSPYAVPRPIPLHAGLRVVSASCGYGHTLLLTDAGEVYSFGDNRQGQLGTGRQGGQHTSPVQVRGANAPIKAIGAGGEFSVMLSESGSVQSLGLPQYGQLGNGEDGEYFITASKLAFACHPSPFTITTFTDGKDTHGKGLPCERPRLVDIKCGTNHTVALTDDGKVFTWGCGDYGRLGHKVQEHEMYPRRVEFFNADNSRNTARLVAVGATCTLVCTEGRTTMMCGRNKNTGEANMYPKPVADLMGWNVRAISCGQTSVCCAAETSLITWGPAPTHGELGYGKKGPKSSTVAKKVDTLEGMDVVAVASGHSHVVMLVNIDKEPEELAKLEARFKKVPLVKAAPPAEAPKAAKPSQPPKKKAKKSAPGDE